MVQESYGFIMKILVTGAHGFLGRSLLGLQAGVEWIACGRGRDSVAGRPYYQLDPNHPENLIELLATVQPDWVINTAALTNVDQCEVERELAQQANLDLVAHLIRGCRQVNAGLVQLSTDYVFDGERGPYTEHDKPNPLSYYGQLKLESEQLVLDGLERAIVVRTLWLYGYIPQVHANFVVRAIEALHQGEQLKIFTDQWGNPTYVDDLSRVLVELCRRTSRGLFHMGGATFMTRYELVLELARFFGLDPQQIEPVCTHQAGLKAVRPLRSGLCTATLESILERRPMNFGEGLEQMIGQDNFRHDVACVL